MTSNRNGHRGARAAKSQDGEVESVNVGNDGENSADATNYVKDFLGMERNPEDQMAKMTVPTPCRSERRRGARETLPQKCPGAKQEPTASPPCLSLPLQPWPRQVHMQQEAWDAAASTPVSRDHNLAGAAPMAGMSYRERLKARGHSHLQRRYGNWGGGDHGRALPAEATSSCSGFGTLPREDMAQATTCMSPQGVAAFPPPYAGDWMISPGSMSPMQEMQELSFQGMTRQGHGVDWQASPTAGSPGSLPLWGPLPRMQLELAEQIALAGSPTGMTSCPTPYSPDNLQTIGGQSPLLAIAMPQAAGHALTNEQIAEMLQAAAGADVYED